MADLPYMDTLGFNEEACWFFCAFLVRLMTINWQVWGGTAHKTERTYFHKRLSIWHMYTLGPMMVEISESYTPPSFARWALGEIRSQDKNVYNLNVLLFIGASRRIISVLADSDIKICAKTLKEFERWSLMMEKVKHSQLFKNVSQNVCRQFKKTLKQLSRKIREKGDKPDSESNYPFFRSDTLFIRIAHMVLFHTSSHAPISNLTRRTNLAPESVILVSASSMYSWEQLSGHLMSKIFDFQKHGLPVTDQAEIPEIRLGMISLPYRQFKHQIVSAKQTVPSLHGLHESLIATVCSSLQLIINENAHQFCVKDEMCMQNWEHLSQKTVRLMTEIGQSRLSQREKFLRHYIRKRGDNPYNPRDPTQFQRDIFLMGRMSPLFPSKPKSSPFSFDFPTRQSMLERPNQLDSEEGDTGGDGL